MNNVMEILLHVRLLSEEVTLDGTYWVSRTHPSSRDRIVQAEEAASTEAPSGNDQDVKANSRRPMRRRSSDG
jgi:hypothetical protein